MQEELERIMGIHERHPMVPDTPSPPSPRPQGLERDVIVKEERIGRGGVAEVYLATAEWREDTFQVAVKEPRFRGTGEDRVARRFQDEAEILREISDHKNIVSLYSWGTEPVPWLASEYISGGTLESREDPMDVEEALWMAGRIAEGIWYSHQHGVAHLDLKPSNILLEETGPDTWDCPRICDWGLARKFLQETGDFEGFSPTHAAPEQFDSDLGRLNDFTDVYQVGNIVYLLLTGELPFSDSPRSVRRSVLSHEPEPPSSRNPEIPPEVDCAVLRALEKEQTDRYGSMKAFRDELNRLFAEYVREPRLKKRA